jgi:hypothetical protein
MEGPANNMRKKRALDYENNISAEHTRLLYSHITQGAAQTFTSLAHFSISGGWCLASY